MSDFPRLDDHQLKERMAVVRAYFRNYSGLKALFDYGLQEAFRSVVDVHDELTAREEEKNG